MAGKKVKKVKKDKTDKLDLINYTTLEPVLLKIHQNYVKPSDNIIYEHRTEFNNFIHLFKDLLRKNDPVINQYCKVENKSERVKSLKSRIGYYYNTYEHEISINIPKSVYKLSSNKPGYVSIQLLTDKLKEDKALDVMKSWLNPSGHIVPYQFKMWAESVMKKFFQPDGTPSMKVGKYIVSIEKTDIGQFVFNVTKADAQIAIDVKVDFLLNFGSCTSPIFENHGLSQSEKWVAVPVLSKNLKPNNLNWRYSFPGAERNILLNQNFLKCVYRLMKIFREAADLTNLKNYHIKNLFMLHTEIQESSFWKKGLSYVFIRMICHLQLAVEQKTLPFYWNKNANLLDDLNDEELNDCRIKLDEFIKKICTSFTVQQQLKLEDFFVNKPDDDDVLSQCMKNMSVKK